MIKILGAACAIIVVISFILAIIKVMSWGLFWIIIIIMAFIAYMVIPWLKKQN
jgi:hypothetical protein